MPPPVLQRTGAPVQREALDQIADKLARICTGDPSWPSAGATWQLRLASARDLDEPPSALV